jgi:hypothetical protein
MVWALVRLVESGDARWWLAAGRFCGPGAVVEIHCRDADTGRAGVCVDTRLAAALADQSLSVGRRGIAAVLFSPVLIWKCAARLGLVPIPVRARGGHT